MVSFLSGYLAVLKILLHPGSLFSEINFFRVFSLHQNDRQDCCCSRHGRLCRRLRPHRENSLPISGTMYSRFVRVQGVAAPGVRPIAGLGRPLGHRIFENPQEPRGRGGGARAGGFPQLLQRLPVEWIGGWDVGREGKEVWSRWRGKVDFSRRLLGVARS